MEVRHRVIGLLGVAVLSAAPGLSPAASAQTPPAAVSWQDLALRAQQNATTEQIVANGMLSALVAENAQLRAELAKLQQSGKPDPPGPPAPMSATEPNR